MRVEAQPSLASAGAPDEEASFHRSLLDGLSDAGLGVIVTDGRRILSANDAFARMMGRAPADLVGLDTTLLVVPEERAEGAARQDARVAQRLPQSFSCTFLRADGTRFRGHVTGKPLRSAEPRFVALVRDLSDEEQARQAVEAARRQVAQSEKLSALGSLVSGVAHEIRTPLTYLQNNLYLLQRQVERALAPDAKREDLSNVLSHTEVSLEATERIARLVDDLRRFTRLKPGERRRATLAEAAREGLSLFEATHRGRTVVRADLRPTPDAHVDALETQQVVLNLLENAADASPPGATIRIATRAEEDGRALLEVSDQGTGIAPHVLPRIFDPFFTTKAQGTGLGLSIVKRIAEGAGAELQCDTAPGKGTTIRMRFPQREGI